ncbi:MAG: hypothetical protein QNJ38_18180 [Prochloraceae cyanobacterium]|nr:hypothetical protein [Prochloraceae cyanobacterium]
MFDELIFPELSDSEAANFKGGCAPSDIDITLEELEIEAEGTVEIDGVLYKFELDAELEKV